jgi:hypothetical protein
MACFLIKVNKSYIVLDAYVEIIRSDIYVYKQYAENVNMIYQLSVFFCSH